VAVAVERILLAVLERRAALVVEALGLHMELQMPLLAVLTQVEVEVALAEEAE
jgi:hypothetical protein